MPLTLMVALNVDDAGSIRAVRYECGSVPLPTDGGQSGGVTCGALLLLDVIDLQLPSAGSRDDDDEDDDECCGGVLGPSAGLGRLSLLGSEESPETLWAVQASGCWAVTLPWLPLLSKALAPSGSQGRMRTAGGAEPGLGAALAELPPPLVRELMSVPSSHAASPSVSAAVQSGPRLVAAAHLHDMFLGDSLVAVTQLPASVSSSAAPVRVCSDTTIFRCFLQRLTAPPDISEADVGATIPVEGGAAAASAGSGTCAPASAPALTPGSVSQERKSLVDASIKAIYADLLKCPPVVLPKPEGGLGGQDQYLPIFVPVVFPSLIILVLCPQRLYHSPPDMSHHITATAQARSAPRTPRARCTCTSASSSCGCTQSSLCTARTRTCGSVCSSWVARWRRTAPLQRRCRL